MSHVADDPRRGAARIVIVSFLSLCVIFGIRLSFSVFFAEFVTVQGWSNEAAATVFSLNMLVFALTAPLAGLALDRYGPRLVFGAGVVLMAGGLWQSSRAHSLNDLLFGYGLIGGLGLGITGLGPVASVIAGWAPPARRGRAIGIAFAGTGLGSLLFVPLANLLIEQFAWRNAYLALALICAFVLFPLMTLGMKRPPTRHRDPKVRAPSTPNWTCLLRNPSFWALLILGLTALGPVRSLTVHQVAYMQSYGVSRAAAANVVGLAGLLATLFFIGLGWLSDRLGRMAAFTVGALGLLAAVLTLLFLRADSLPMLLIFYALFYALGEATRSSQTTALASDVFHKQGLGMINGLVGGMFGLGAALGPWLVGRLRDQSGTYDAGLLMVVAMVLASLLAFGYIAWRSGEPARD